MTDNTPGQVPEALPVAKPARIAELLRILQTNMGPRRPDPKYPEDRLLWDWIDATCEALTATPAQPADGAAHVQKPAKNEHVAGDVSGNGAEVNMSTQQPAPATQQAGDVVAYLDVGAGGYLDLEAALSDEAMQQLPKGRHALVIAGTYGIDGYVAAPQPAPATQQAADSVLEDAARYRWLRAGVRERQGIPVSGHRTMSSNHLRALMEFNFWCTPDELDAAIDAARSQAKEGA